MTYTRLEALYHFGWTPRCARAAKHQPEGRGGKSGRLPQIVARGYNQRLLLLFLTYHLAPLGDERQGLV